MQDLTDIFEDLSPTTRRLQALGLITEMHDIAQRLNEVNDAMDSELSIEDAYLDYDAVIGGHTFMFKPILNPKSYQEDPDVDTAINHLTDILPMENKDYDFTFEKADKLKTGMRQVCSNAILDGRDISFAINKGVAEIFRLLKEIEKKKKNIPDYQYENYWYDLMGRDDDLIPERVHNEYEEWKEENDASDMQTLRDKQTQEIYFLLKSGVFRYSAPPKNRDIRNSVITISEDALEPGMIMPDKIEIDCARMSQFVEKKKDIICFDYVKLGRYLYRHCSELSETQEDKLIRFDYMMDFVHEDMANCNTKLRAYLKGYEDDKNKETLERGIENINACKVHLREGVNENFLEEMLTAAFYNDDIKKEVQTKLGNQSRYTIICQMLNVLKSTLRVFRAETTASDLAKSLAQVVQEMKEESLKRYIEESKHIKSKVSQWVANYVKEKLYNEQERVFVDLAKNKVFISYSNNR